MKIKKLLVCFFSVLFVVGCNTKHKSSEVASYKYDAESDKKQSVNVDVPDWVKEGTICYGLVVQHSKEEEYKYKKGKPVKAIVVSIGEHAVKLKALETVSLVKTIGCDQQRIVIGEVWDEVDGDIYKTREEAIEVLKKKHLYIEDDKVTVD